MVGHKVRREGDAIFVCMMLCKGMGEITGEIWFELELGEAQSLADEIYGEFKEGDFEG